MLVFVLSLLVNMKDRRRVLLVGGTFVLASGVVYFKFMAARLNVFLLVGISRPIQVGLGGLATLIGLVNLKDFVAFGRGFSFSIPDSAKPTIYARMRAVLQAKSIASALGAVIVLALLVNTVELLCTSGLPAVYTQILVARDLPIWQYYGYLALYNVFYMLDDSLLLAAAVVTLRISKLQERGGRVLKLVSGAVMLLLGLALILRPEWLEWGGGVIRIDWLRCAPVGCSGAPIGTRRAQRCARDYARGVQGRRTAVVDSAQGEGVKP